MNSFITIIPANEQEKLAYATIKAILATKVAPERIYGKKEFCYFSVYVDKDVNKCICRVVVENNKTALNIYFPSLNKNVEVLNLVEIREYAKYIHLSFLEL